MCRLTPKNCLHHRLFLWVSWSISRRLYASTLTTMCLYYTLHIAFVLHLCLQVTCHWFQPTFERWINVGSTLWIKVETSLIERWKWNKLRRQIFKVAQFSEVETTLHNESKTVFQRCTTSFHRCFNNDMRLSQRCLNVVSTLVKAI